MRIPDATTGILGQLGQLCILHRTAETVRHSLKNLPILDLVLE